MTSSYINVANTPSPLINGALIEAMPTLDDQDSLASEVLRQLTLQTTWNLRSDLPVFASSYPVSPTMSLSGADGTVIPSPDGGFYSEARPIGRADRIVRAAMGRGEAFNLSGLGGNDDDPETADQFIHPAMLHGEPAYAFGLARPYDDGPYGTAPNVHERSYHHRVGLSGGERSGGGGHIFPSMNHGSMGYEPNERVYSDTLTRPAAAFGVDQNIALQRTYDDFPGVGTQSQIDNSQRFAPPPSTQLEGYVTRKLAGYVKRNLAARALAGYVEGKGLDGYVARSLAGVRTLFGGDTGMAGYTESLAGYHYAPSLAGLGDGSDALNIGGTTGFGGGAQVSTSSSNSGTISTGDLAIQTQYGAALSNVNMGAAAYPTDASLASTVPANLTSAGLLSNQTSVYPDGSILTAVAGGGSVAYAPATSIFAVQPVGTASPTDAYSSGDQIVSTDYNGGAKTAGGSTVVTDMTTGSSVLNTSNGSSAVLSNNAGSASLFAPDGTAIGQVAGTTTSTGGSSFNLGSIVSALTGAAGAVGKLLNPTATSVTSSAGLGALLSNPLVLGAGALALFLISRKGGSSGGSSRPRRRRATGRISGTIS